MCLKQTHLDDLPNVVRAVNSAFTCGAKLQCFLKIVLCQRLRRCRKRIPKRKLRIRIGRRVGRASVQLSESGVVIASTRVILQGRPRVECLSRSRTDGEEWKVN